jgi:hypothetical protein
MPTVARLKDNLMIAGEVNERLPAVTDGLVVHFPFDGTEKGISKKLMMDYTIWKEGQVGTIGDFVVYNEEAHNSRIIDIDPFGKPTVLWKVQGGSGGIYYRMQPIDNTKMYRMSWWQKRVTNANATACRMYIGLNGYGTTDGVFELGSTTYVTNPYFWSTSSFPTQEQLPVGEWILVVGHVFPHTHTGTTNHPDSGRYKITGRVGNITRDYRWAPDTTQARSRCIAVHTVDDPNVTHYIAYPRMDLCDGTEPTIEDLLRGEGAVYNYPLMNRREPVKWTDGVNAAISGNSIQKTASTSEWDSGARSAQVFDSGNVFVEWRLSYQDLAVGAEMMGLTYTNHPQHNYTYINFALYTHQNGNITVYENGNNRGTVSTWDKTANNVFRVAVENGVVRYYHNNNLVYTSAMTPVYPIYADCSMHCHGGHNAVVDAHIGVNNLCTLTNEGIAIEEAVTNIIPTSRRLFEGWTQYQSCVATVTQGQHVPEWNTHQATRIQTTGGTSTLKYLISVVSPSVNGQAYTSQCRIKNIGRNPVVFATQLGGTVTVQPGETTLAVCSVTGNGTSNLQFRFQTTVVEHNLDILVFQPQVETRAFPTSFVDGARISPGRLSIPTPINLQQSFTIGAWTKVNKTDGYRMICGDWNTFYFSWYDNSTDRLILSWVDGSQKTLVTSVMAGIDSRNWNYVAFSYNAATTTAKIYCNGILRTSSNTVNFTDVPDGRLAIGDIDNSSSPDTYKLNGIVRNFSIYNRVLTDEEHMKLAGSNMSLRQDGGIIVPNLICKPIIPASAKYFPLTADGNDINHVITPVTETNTSYNRNGYWSGTGTTNLQNGATHRWWVSSGITMSYEAKSKTHIRVYGKQTNEASGGVYYYPVFAATGNTYYTLSCKAVLNHKVHTSNGSYVRMRLRAGNNGSTVGSGSLIYLKDMIVGKVYNLEWSGLLPEGETQITVGGYIGYELALNEEIDLEVFDIQLEQSSFSTPFTESTRGASGLFLPYSIIDCKTDFTIFGWWYPKVYADGVYRPCLVRNRLSSNYTSHRIMIMGSNTTSRRLRCWFGSGGSESTVYAPSSIGVIDNVWNFFCLRRSVDTMSLFIGNNNGFGYGTSVNGAMLNTEEDPQTFGWMIGRYSNTTNISNAFHKNYCFIQSALSDEEIQSIYRTHMRQKNGLQIQGTIIEGMVI